MQNTALGGEKAEIVRCVSSNLVSMFIDWIYEMRFLRGSGTPVLYLECTVVCSVLLLCVSEADQIHIIQLL
jgi:hypothetical protein